MSLVKALLAFVLACGLALYLTPIIIKAALKYGIVDRPQGALKTHREPVPYLGGLVVFMATIAALATTAVFDAQVLAVLLCASIVVSVGLVDDLGTLTPKDKFLGQILASLVLVKAGVTLHLETLPTPWAELVSIFWMLTAINAFNIIDVSDGLAGTAGLVGALAFVALGALNHDPFMTVFAASLAGALGGFLWWNREPARIYLGDTGSMLLGAVLGALALLGRYSEVNMVSAGFAPLAFLGIALFDLALVVVARLWARRPIYHGSPDHFAVRMRDHGVRPRVIAWSAGALGALLATLGLVSTQLDDAGAAVVALSGVAGGGALLALILARLPARTSPRFHARGPAIADPSSTSEAPSAAPPSPRANVEAPASDIAPLP